MTLQEDPFREAMTGDMPGRNRIPAPMLHGDAGFIAGPLESHFDMSNLLRREGFLPPGEGKPRGGLPCGDSSDFEYLTAGQSLDEASTHAFLEGERPG